MENPSYYAIIPANVRYDNDLTPNAKLLYGEITALCNKDGRCWASNNYFSKLYNVSKTSISKWINQLIKNGYLTSEIEYKEGSKEILHRYIRIVNEPMKEKLKGGIKEKLKDNNININNTNNTTKDVVSDKKNRKSAKHPKNNLFNFYNNNYGLITPFISDSIISFLDDGVEEELMLRYLQIGIENNKRNWNYVKVVAQNNLNLNIKTLEQFNAKEKEREFKKETKSGEFNKVEQYNNFAQRDYNDEDLEEFYS